MVHLRFGRDLLAVCSRYAAGMVQYFKLFLTGICVLYNTNAFTSTCICEHV